MAVASYIGQYCNKMSPKLKKQHSKQIKNYQLIFSTILRGGEIPEIHHVKRCVRTQRTCSPTS